jgi:hypothetical protein
MKEAPAYVPGHGLLKGRSVLITAAAGAGIGFCRGTALRGGGLPSPDDLRHPPASP